ncbi:protein of unknown function [Methylorubrum extorquens DM4]|uniref:DUF2933 domain-containing protein n=1 Tax=Methylorubrum extorquens (strain DSM 6343 / CIP 106787 / DM4) TaxID=661410 RepID=C7CFX8_METED|nr:DUF2933 domain-containing protein [Methylorubrum extorquens]CAX23054.1 protein of unknown function [Methylorubrum extorquens DM4]
MPGSSGQSGGTIGSGRTRQLVLVAFLLIGAFYLLTEHRAHAFGVLPWLLLLACPLLHLFMHGGHGHGREEAARDPTSSSSPHS